MTIKLSGLLFFAYHGVHPEERVLGNSFEVNVEINYPHGSTLITSLDQTINYQGIFDIINAAMAVPTPLLETLAQEIALQIGEQYAMVEEIIVSIKKKRPPVPGWLGDVEVGFTWKKGKQ